MPREYPESVSRSIAIASTLYSRQVHRVALLGIASITLYILLYCFSDNLSRLATLSQQGDKTYCFLPIAIAFVFSLIHGAFTDRFWDMLGIKAKKQTAR